MSDAWQLEGSVDRWLLEDGSGVWLIDAVGFTLDNVSIDVDPAELAIVLDEVVIEVTPGELTQSIATSPSYYTGGKAPRWRVRVVGLASADYQGYGELVSAVPSYTHRLNGLSEARISVSTADPAYQYIGEEIPQRLIEVWLDGDLKMRGYPVRTGIDRRTQTATIQVLDELWPVTRRVFGRADRINLLTNGGFEDSASSFSPWAQSGAGTVTIDTSIVNEDSRSLKMVGGNGTYVYQARVVRHTYTPGLVVRFAVYFHIPAGGTSPDGNLAGVIKITDPDLPTRPYFYGFTIDDDAERGGWDRRYVDALLSRANHNYTVEVRLYGTTETIYYDSAQLIFNDATTVAFPGEDQAVAFRKVMEYAQDPGSGKSDLGIATDCATTGVNVLVAWAHADHRGIYEALTELAAMPDSPDTGLVVTPTLTTFKTYYPEKGSTHREWQLEEGRNLVDVDYEVDLSQLSTSVIMLGSTPDFDREEGAAVDTTQAGGLVLERVVKAQPNTPVRLLDKLAEHELDNAKQPVVHLRGTVSDPNRELIHGVEVGDTLPVRVESGWSDLDGVKNYRLVAYTVPPSADRIEPQLVPVPA